MRAKFFPFILISFAAMVSFAQVSGSLPPIKKVESPKPTVTTQKSPPTQVKSAELIAVEREDGFWSDAKAGANHEAFEAYIKNYPNGRYVDLARANIARLTTLIPVAGSVIKDCAECPEMVVIPAGRFVMGAIPGEEEREKLPENLRNRSVPQHQVNISTFMAGRYEVTVGQYKTYALSSNRSNASGCVVWNGTKFENDMAKDWRNPGFHQSDSQPVACVSWEDATAYVQWLKQRTGKEYRLLTEAEWEYAARAGTTTARFWGEDVNISCVYANGTDLKAKANVPGYSNFIGANCDDGYAYTAPVGNYKANEFGLYDMLGNLVEWTQDCWNDNYSGAPVDGSAWTTGDCSVRVQRGGSWHYSPHFLRSAFRVRSFSANRFNFSGFRIARAIEGNQKNQSAKGATGGENANVNALNTSGPSDSYAGRVSARIKPNITFSGDRSANLVAEVDVRTSPDGTIMSSKLFKSSGNKVWDEAVLRAIEKTVILPRDTDGQVPNELRITFSP